MPAKSNITNARHYNAQITTSSKQISPATEQRNYLAIWNTGGLVGYLRFGQSCQASNIDSNGDIPISAGDYIIWDHIVPVDSINLVCPGGNTTFTILEGKQVNG